MFSKSICGLVVSLRWLRQCGGESRGIRVANEDGLFVVVRHPLYTRDLAGAASWWATSSGRLPLLERLAISHECGTQRGNPGRGLLFLMREFQLGVVRGIGLKWVGSESLIAAA